MAHTPGNWYEKEWQDSTYIGFGSDSYIAEVFDPKNAPLIAAAPDLLAVLVEITNAADAEHFSATDPYREIINQARAVIARVTGS